MTATLDPLKTHGGALGAAIGRYGGDRRDWLDLSTGINPVPTVLPELGAEVWSKLPERADEDRLIEAARDVYEAPEAAGIAIAPGSQALISLLPFCIEPGLAAVLAPTYSEHAAAFASAGHSVQPIRDPNDVPNDARIVVLVNPNNPDGRRFAPDALLALSDRLAARGGWLVVDEAFADPEPTLSLAPHTGRDGLLVYRSFGKFTGLAGLRLGFALTTQTLAARLTMRLGPWAVSGPAVAVGETFFRDRERIAQTRHAIAEQSGRLKRLLTDCGLETVGGTALFQTIRHPNAALLHESLCRRHVLARPFDYAPDWLRIGNPAGVLEAERLQRALGESLEETSRTIADDAAYQSG